MTDADLKRAIISFQFSEKIKSELIIASKLLFELNNLKGAELEGAKKLMELFLNVLLGEIKIAYNILKSQNFDDASVKITEIIAKIRLNEYQEATNYVSEALSSITTSGQRAMQILRNKELI